MVQRYKTFLEPATILTFIFFCSLFGRYFLTTVQIYKDFFYFTRNLTFNFVLTFTNGY